MKERLDAVGPLKPSGTRKFCGDIDVLRKEELKRRRLLRLEQVRQQSKDIAGDIRNKVRLEKDFLTENYQKKTEVAVSQWKEQKLTALQTELTETLSYVGCAHKQAEIKSEQQEAKQHLKDLHVEAADRRGREAILRLRSDELARRKAEEARRLHQQQVRSIEEARTAVVVSLPPPKSTVPVGVVPRVTKPDVVRKDKSAESSKKQWPSKPWPVSIPLGVTPAQVEVIDSNRTNSSAKPGVSQEGTNDLSACPHKPPSDTATERQGIPGGDAPSKASSSKLSSRESRRTIPASKRSVESKEVELYDYTNGSHIQYVKPSAVSKSIPAGPIDGLEAAEACASNSDVRYEASRTQSAKRIERGREAVKRVKTRREHQALLSELANLVRQQATLRSFLPEPQEPKKVQKKMNEAVMDLLEDSSEEDVEKKNLESADSQPAQVVPVSPESSDEENETLHVSFQDETIGSENSKRPSKENRGKGEGAADTEGKTLKQNLIERKSPQTKGKDDSYSANETSHGSDVPQLNLALWTSRSPGSSDLGDKTLTPSQEQRSSNSSASTEDNSSRDKTLTPTEKRSFNSSASMEEKSKSFKKPSRPGKPKTSITGRISPPSQGANISSTSRIPPVEKYQSQKEKDAFMLGAGDCVPKQQPPKEETDTPRQLPEDRRRSKKLSPSSSSTSYMSLPNKLLSAITDDLRSLLSLTRQRQNPDDPSHSNPLLAHYINRLLDMSRQSVERLNVITSEIPTPASAVFRNASYDSERPDGSLNLDEADRPSGFVASTSVSASNTDTTKVSDSSASSDSSQLVNVMQQCHARISALSQMIEKVRQDSGASTPVHRRRPPSLHLDSTAYMSPPSSLMASPQVLPRNVELPGRNNPMDDTYNKVITRLISEIRQQLAEEAEKPLQISLSPPRGPAKNTKSSSSNELSTIPEQDSNSLEWSSVVISSETGGSSEDVEKEFSRMGLGWAGMTLRKTKEACTLDSNSSSDFLELSALSMFGSYSHSTPIKTAEDKQSRT